MDNISIFRIHGNDSPPALSVVVSPQNDIPFRKFFTANSAQYVPGAVVHYSHRFRDFTGKGELLQVGARSSKRLKPCLCKIIADIVCRIGLTEGTGKPPKPVVVREPLHMFLQNVNIALFRRLNCTSRNELRSNQINKKYYKTEGLVHAVIFLFEAYGFPAYF